ncbi:MULTISPECIES: hypothetical protein [Cyanophyceae]|jgi:hypothetical protein|uniref:Uncharacterized protein n=3 Tax=Nodularia spumigena TaxID=70799 RepID=A0A2S0Q8W6_NODSP|nr:MULTISPECIES: hypothetical protein [Cyanophyceae]MDB9355851.1 hypothetical protein [Nodularia spumigena CS-587/03]AVZ30811.1 hypothetical protein BMF81_02809 [Nodularia spumigena UHCC 0039]KZL50374.1 hypothetical protein A2T98_07820 [Nodularia spumigena CENA596]MDB9305910.1 hypothetical protein [Nodularia spumigena CS-591/12]MDB9318021.1 hypothetical protein [Nodularia spumigena CS-590/01A]
MNTPSHAILNLVIFNQQLRDQASPAILIGAVLPDIPIFVFYLLMKFVYRLPEKQIWSEVYYQPFWQGIVSTFHSVPLAVLGLLIAHFWNWQLIEIALISMVLHSLLDFPVHNNDAHRHFFPLSNYRFISPVSYWDRNHYGAIAALVEFLLVIGATIVLFSSTLTHWGKVILIAVNVFYLVGYYRFYLKSSSD